MRFLNKGVLLEDGSLVIADLHLGYEEALNKEGVFLPKQQYKEIIRDLKEIFREVEVKRVIILGDLKHEFGKISKQEWREILDFFDFLKKKVGRVILVKGNHDDFLNPIAEKKNLEIRDYYQNEGDLFIHGDKKVKGNGKVKRVFMGHLHPAISIRRGAKEETYKCFLKGRWGGKDIVILPSFFPLVEGSDVIIEDTNLGYNFNLENFKVYVVGEEVLGFGKVGDAGELNS
jgi:hypothetical protein